MLCGCPLYCSYSVSLPWRHSYLLIEPCKLSKHLVRGLGIRIQLLSDRIDWFRECLDVVLVCTLTFNWCSRYLGRLWDSRSWAPVWSSPKHLLLNLLFLSFELAGLFLSHKVLAHSFFAFAYIKMLHIVWHDLPVCVWLRFKCCVFFLNSLCFCHLLLFLQFWFWDKKINS